MSVVSWPFCSFHHWHIYSRPKYRRKMPRWWGIEWKWLEIFHRKLMEKTQAAANFNEEIWNQWNPSRLTTENHSQTLTLHSGMCSKPCVCPACWRNSFLPLQKSFFRSHKWARDTIDLHALTSQVVVELWGYISTGFQKKVMPLLNNEWPASKAKLLRVSPLVLTSEKWTFMENWIKNSDMALKPYHVYKPVLWLLLGWS